MNRLEAIQTLLTRKFNTHHSEGGVLSKHLTPGFTSQQTKAPLRLGQALKSQECWA